VRLLIAGINKGVFQRQQLVRLLISNFRRVVNVVCFFPLGNSPASEIQTPGNYLEEKNIQLVRRVTVSDNGLHGSDLQSRQSNCSSDLVLHMAQT
jgi:hypothetical protein